MMAARFVNLGRVLSRHLVRCKVYPNSSRSLSSTSVSCRKSNIHGNPNKYMKYLDRKLATGSKKKSWQFSTGDSQLGGAKMQRQITQGAYRRAENLSKVLYDYVTSLMNSGEIIPELPNLGFQVTKVEMHPDLSHLKVYWEASGTSSDKVIEDSLIHAPAILRRTLIGLRIMGSIPNIHFMKDIAKARIQAVDHLLALADMGPDYIPTKLGEELKTQAKVPASADLQKHFAELNSKFQQKDLFGSAGRNDISIPVSAGYSLGEISDSDDNEVDTVETELQAIDDKLRSDVYGVNHTLLTQKLAATKAKARPASVQDPVEMPTSSILDSLPYSVMHKKPKVKLDKIEKFRKEAENEAIREIQHERYDEWKNNENNNYENELETSVDEEFYADWDNYKK